MGGAWWAKRVKILLIASAAPMASARQVCLGGACHGRGEVPAGRGGGGPGGERLSVQGDAAGGGGHLTCQLGAGSGREERSACHGSWVGGGSGRWSACQRQIISGRWAPGGGLSGQSGRRHAKRGLGGVVRAAGEAGRGGSTCQTLQLARRRMGRARKRLSKGSWAGPGRSACHGEGGRSREGAGGACQSSWAGGVLSGGAKEKEGGGLP